MEYPQTLRPTNFNFVKGFRLWNTHKLYALRCRLDGAEDNYNPSPLKRDMKDKSDKLETLDTSSSNIDLALVSVVAVVDSQDTVKSPGRV